MLLVIFDHFILTYFHSCFYICFSLFIKCFTIWCEWFSSGQACFT